MHKKKAPHETVVQNVPVGSSVRSWAADVEENIGNRDYNEDRWIGLDGWREDPTQGLFAVLDGHGGSRAVDFVIEGFADVFAE
jgi:serine/threonine protein phosphatase PrpC